MAREQFIIQRRPGYGDPIIVEIECAPNAASWVKLGLAAAKAHEAGANLAGAYLAGANLAGANLARADLAGANLAGATIKDDKIKRVIARITRLDGYEFIAFELEAGGLKIMAGCRWFALAEYVAHVAAEYPDTDKATETLLILDFCEDRARHMGVVL